MIPDLLDVLCPTDQDCMLLFVDADHSLVFETVRPKRNKNRFCLKTCSIDLNLQIKRKQKQKKLRKRPCIFVLLSNSWSEKYKNAKLFLPFWPFNSVL